MDGLVVGTEYQLQVAVGLNAEGAPRSWKTTGNVTPEKAGKSDIGDREFNERER